MRCNIFARAGGHSGLAGGHGPPWPPLATGLVQREGKVWFQNGSSGCSLGRVLQTLSRIGNWDHCPVREDFSNLTLKDVCCSAF